MNSQGPKRDGQLPQGWRWATIEELSADKLLGVVRARRDQRPTPPGNPYVRMDAVTREGQVRFEHLTYVDTSEREVEKYELRDGDILFNTRNSRELVGKTGLVRRPPPGAIHNNNLMRLRFKEVVLPAFVNFVMNSPQFKIDLDGRKSATTNVAAIYAKNLLPMRLPVPPLDQQRRIVDAIETHLSHLDAGVESLHRAKRNIERMRASVLKTAVEGRLVEQDPDDEPAEGLLERMLEERREAWEAEQLTKYEAKGNLPETESWKSKYQASPSVDALGPLPEHWLVVPMETLAETRLGKMLSKKARQGVNPKPYLRNQNVQWGRFDLKNVAEMDILADEVERYRLRRGDLLVCEGGEVARCAIWDGQLEEAYYQKALHRVRPHGNAQVEWVALVLEYLASNKLLDSFITGSTIDHLPQEDLRRIPVPLPPPEEQARILTEVDRQMSLLSALDRDVDVETARSRTLRRSILQSAYSGTLVSSQVFREQEIQHVQ